MFFSAVIEKDMGSDTGDRWSVKHESLPCDYYEVSRAVDGETFVITSMLHCPSGFDIDASDRIAVVTAGNGERVAGVMYITDLSIESDHYELSLTGVDRDTIAVDERIYLTLDGDPLTLDGRPIYLLRS